MKKWLLSLLIASFFVITMYGFCIFMSYNPTFSDSFCEYFGANFVFRDNPKHMWQFALMESLWAIPVGTCFVRCIWYVVENFNWEE